MDSWLNYHHLYYFKTIAHAGSIAAASEKLRLGQPTLSAQLKTLEENLGVTLFERKHKRLHLTEAGKVALRYADEIFKAGSELLEVLQDRKRPDRIHVELGALDSIPKHLLYTLVQSAHHLGSCSVTLREGGMNELIRELLAHRIDLILTNHLPDPSGDAKLISKRIKSYPIAIFAHPRFKSLRKNFPHSISGAPMVLPTSHSRMRFDLDHYFETLQITPDVVAETQDTALQKILGAKGVGIVPLSSFAASTLIKSKSLILLGPLDGVSESIYLVSAKRRIENPISKELMRNFKL